MATSRCQSSGQVGSGHQSVGPCSWLDVEGSGGVAFALGRRRRLCWRRRWHRALSVSRAMPAANFDPSPAGRAPSRPGEPRAGPPPRDWLSKGSVEGGRRRWWVWQATKCLASPRAEQAGPRRRRRVAFADTKDGGDGAADFPVPRAEWRQPSGRLWRSSGGEISSLALKSGDRRHGEAARPTLWLPLRRRLWRGLGAGRRRAQQVCGARERHRALADNSLPSRLRPAEA